MVDSVATPRADVIEHFAATLRALRASAGSPSFRTMSGRSQAISHTTLHDAVRGHRLPSWATTAEFVKACDGNPADFRAQWEQSNQATRSAALPPNIVGTNERSDETAETNSGKGPPRPARRRRNVTLSTALVGALVAAGVGIAISRADTPPNRPGPTATAPALTAADCPVKQVNPPLADPPNPGDAGAFVADRTLPDCSHVARGSTVVKIWRLRNIGTVPWHGYALHRIDMPEQLDQCQTITDAPIPDTQPGQVVDISVTVMAPNGPGFCFVRFKVEDGFGRIAFPSSRPVNFQLIVD